MANKKIPMRQCIGCGDMKPKREMVRILKTADGQITLDMTGRKNGRGAYICPKEECLNKAVKNKGIERSFRMPVPGEVYEMLTKEMGELEAR